MTPYYLWMLPKKITVEYLYQIVNRAEHISDSDIVIYVHLVLRTCMTCILKVHAVYYYDKYLYFIISRVV